MRLKINVEREKIIYIILKCLNYYDILLVDLYLMLDY